MQIIVLAMVAGVITFGLVVQIVVGPDVRPGTPFLMYVGLLMACVMIPTAWIVPELMSRGLPPVAGSYQVKLIVGLALLEGAAFLNLVAYLLEGRTLSLWMAVLLAGLLAMRFPTVAGVENWLEGRKRVTEDEAAFGHR